MIPDRPGDVLAAAVRNRVAIPGLNANNLETAQAIVAAADELASPVFLQISSGAIAYAGYEALRDIALSVAGSASVPVLVHLDHCRDPDLVRRALRDGFPSVMFDGSPLPLEENVRLTAELAHEAAAHGAIIEGELGIIGGAETATLDEARAGVTSPEAAASFVAATDVDVLAPAIGSLHRMPEDSVTLDLALLRAVASAADRPIALHGGTGIDRRQLPDLIAAGVAKVNVSSAVGRAFAAGIRAAWEADPPQLDIRGYLGAARDAVRRLAGEYIERCGSAGLAERVGAAAARSAWSDTLEEPE